MALAAQGQINGGLGKKIGVIESSFMNFAVGTLVLLFILKVANYWGLLGVFLCIGSGDSCP
jgi:uncharacterized membrane protein YdcZ (DUF606 family)